MGLIHEIYYMNSILSHCIVLENRSHIFITYRLYLTLKVSKCKYHITETKLP